MRIISTVPSLTETLYDLKLDEEVVGITKFCVHPREWFLTKTRVGGTKNLHIDKIRSLKPDLIIANKEENTKEQIEECQSFCDVYVNDPSNFEEALETIETIGQLTNRASEAKTLISDIHSAFGQLSECALKDAVYLIWKDPLMTIGNDTFIHNMMEKAGYRNLYGNLTRYPEITEESLVAMQPGLLLLSSEPYPFSEKHLPYFEQLLPDTKIMFVDGEMFSWYGSRMRLAATYFSGLKRERGDKN